MLCEDKERRVSVSVCVCVTSELGVLSQERTARGDSLHGGDQAVTRCKEKGLFSAQGKGGGSGIDSGRPSRWLNVGGEKGKKQRKGQNPKTRNLPKQCLCHCSKSESLFQGLNFPIYFVEKICMEHGIGIELTLSLKGDWVWKLTNSMY